MADEAWNIDMDPAKTITVRVEGDFYRITEMLGDAVGSTITAFEVTSTPPQYAEDTPCYACDTHRHNRLNLYSVRAIAEDTSETEPRYIMAQHEEAAALLYHKARAQEHENVACEIVVSKIADAEVCDE